MQTLWKYNLQMPSYPPLGRDIQVDACVIGGGMAGLLTAYFLQNQGLQTCVLEAKTIGSGQTGRTTAKITAQHQLLYGDLIHTKGLESAQEYAAAQRQALDDYRTIIQKHKISCDFEQQPAFLYTQTNPELLKEEAEAARRLGFSAHFTLDVNLPFPVKGALRFDGQAQFHPLLFLKALSQTLTIYEHTKAVNVEEGRVITDTGAQVRAKEIIIATHFPFLNLPGYYFLRMHQERSYVLALEESRQLGGMYLGIDPDGLSLRNSGNYLLLGGANHRTGENTSGGRYETLRRAAKTYFPNAQEAFRWSAQDCMTLDRIPYIGRYAPSTPQLYVATGFGKWGMTSSMVAARLLTEEILRGTEKSSQRRKSVFSPRRLPPLTSSMKALASEGKHAVHGLMAGTFEGAQEALSALEAGHGGIVDIQGEACGVYKDEHGEVYAILPKCPHLGCRLEWNPDERSWDCPCHGSRFDFRGNLLDNPAMEGLSHV